MRGLFQKVYRLAKTGFFHIFGSSVINKIMVFTSNVVLVRILSKTEYGAFTYAWNIYSIIFLFNGMGIESGVLQLASERSSDEQYTSGISGYGYKFGIVFDLALAGIIVLIGFFAPLKIQSGRNLLILLCFLPCTQLLFGLQTVYLRSKKRNQDFAKLNTLHTVALFLLSVLLVLLFRESGMVFGYYAAAFVSIFAGIAVFHVPLYRDTPSIQRADRNILLKISFITMCNNVLSHLLYLLDLFVLGIVDPQETILASYKVATTIPTACAFVPLAIMTYAYPYFAEKRNDNRWCFDHYKKLLIYGGLLNASISLILYLFADYFIGLLYGKEYLDAVPVFKILVINYFFSGTFRVISGNILVTQRKLKFNLLVAVISSAVNIIADYFFIKWWGAIGAAYATVLVVFVSSVLSTGYLFYTFHRNKKEQLVC